MTDNKIYLRVENTPSAEIDFRDISYIEDNQEFLQIANWQDALKAFMKAQPENERMSSLQKEQQQLAEELQPLHEKAEQQKQQVEAREQQKQEEYVVVERIFKFKKELLDVLPDKYVADGERFINNFIMQRAGDNFMPGEGPTSKGLKEKALKLMFAMQLKKFKKEFEQKSADFKDFSPSFDLYATKEAVYAEIDNRYNNDALDEEYKQTIEKQAQIAQRQDELTSEIEKQKVSLDKKQAYFKSYYDKKLYAPAKDEGAAFSTVKEQTLRDYGNISHTWREVMNEVGQYDIHFSEVNGLWEDNVPVAAKYDDEHNGIVCNGRFAIDEQLYAVAEILIDWYREPLGSDYNVRSRYQFELCRQAEKVAKMVAMGEELALALPTFRAHVYSLYKDETVEYLSGKSAANKYAKAFVKSLSSYPCRQITEQVLVDEIKAEATDATSKKGKSELNDLPMGEILNRFATEGVSLINDYPALRQLLDQIPQKTKSALQELASKDKDSSLNDMADFK